MTNEAFSRVKIDAQLTDDGWETQNPNAGGRVWGGSVSKGAFFGYKAKECCW
jgi:hypothetical protein